MADFGLTTRMKDEGQYNTMCGTPQWMAPEVASGSSYNEAADVFSFGVVLWELYSRKQPFQGLNPMQAMMGVQRGDRPQIPESCPASLRNLIRLCWDQVPERRPSFKGIVSHLQNMIDDTSIIGTPGR